MHEDSLFFFEKSGLMGSGGLKHTRRRRGRNTAIFGSAQKPSKAPQRSKMSVSDMSVDLVNILALSILTLSLSLSLVRAFSLSRKPNANNLWEGQLARPRSVPQSVATASQSAPPQPPTYAVQP